MDFQELKRNIKKAWNWTWNSDSALSWLVALVIIFVMVKFVFFPLLSLVMGTSLPLAGVESSSMDHQMVKVCLSYDNYGKCSSSTYEICGKLSDNKEHLNFNEYWNTCGNWYEEKGITKDIFSKFNMKNGFSKGDIIVVWGRFTPKIGDIIIFKPNSDSNAPRPIIHRIVDINGIIQTKGDHNQKQLVPDNNIYKTDETKISENQIIGKAIFKIPYLGWIKIWISELISMIIPVNF